ncbi:MAG: serine--tRNA ligase, partial [Clostridia bacterium]|nr:serine--tRNA ligase [Clostridia bacterium]
MYLYIDSLIKIIIIRSTYMLDIYLIRNNPEMVKAALAKKGYTADFTALLEWDSARRAKIAEVEAFKAKRNKVSGEIPRLKKAGQPVDEIFEEMRRLGDDIAEGDAVINELADKVFDYLSGLPNMPDEDLVAGEKESNVVVKTFGEKPVFNYTFKNHTELCSALNLIDYERGVKLAGGGHWIYRGIGARIEWALLNFFIEEHLADGYEFILPPHMLNYNCGFGAGQFPKFAEDVYWLEGEDRKKGRFMLPTAETALVNLYAGEIIDESKLPLKF